MQELEFDPQSSPLARAGRNSARKILETRYALLTDEPLGRRAALLEVRVPLGGPPLLTPRRPVLPDLKGGADAGNILTIP